MTVEYTERKKKGGKNNEGQVVVKNERKYYLDNIRVLIILGLFVAHSCEMYHLQDGFYIEGAKSLIPTIIYNSLRSWYMATLFLIAGLTTMYSLKKRTIKEYYIERCKRLLIPFLAGILLLVPVQSYFVMKNHYGFNGNIFEAYVHFLLHILMVFMGMMEALPHHIYGF